MAKPNRVFANIPKRSPVEQIRCRSLSHAHEVAEQKRAEGFDAKATQRRFGSRRNPGREYTCFVYEKMKRPDWEVRT
jgi:hypothetical protein